YRKTNESPASPSDDGHLNLILLPGAALQFSRRELPIGRQRGYAHLHPPLQRIWTDLGEAHERLSPRASLAGYRMACRANVVPGLLLLEGDDHRHAEVGQGVVGADPAEEVNDRRSSWPHRFVAPTDEHGLEHGLPLRMGLENSGAGRSRQPFMTQSKVYLITARGEVVENPRHYRTAEQQPAKAQKRLSRRTKRSKRRYQAAHQLAKKHQ